VYGDYWIFARYWSVLLAVCLFIITRKRLAMNCYYFILCFLVLFWNDTEVYFVVTHNFNKHLNVFVLVNIDNCYLPNGGLVSISFYKSLNMGLISDD